MAAKWVLHVDLDQFIAAVEVLRRPELRGRPVVVGGDGDPAKRGVVATASYEAREYGVHSGLALRTAARRLPRDAVFLPVDRTAYEAASEQVMDVLRASGAVVEVMGWDEAFVGVLCDAPEEFARSLRESVLESTRLSCSVGIGENKLQAKIATGFGKPAGIFRLTSANWYEVLGARPTDALWGIGSKTSKKLAALGIASVSQLAEASPDELAAAFGPMTGPWLVMLGRGIGDRDVDPSPYVAKGHGKEETFQVNIASWDRVRGEVGRIAGLLAAELAVSDPDRPIARVVVKVRYAPFITETHGVAVLDMTLAEAALAALDRFTGRRPVRLLGVRAEFTLSRAGPHKGRDMTTSSRAGSEGSGWRSPVSAKPQRSYRRRAGLLLSVTQRFRLVMPAWPLAHSVTRAISASPTPRPLAFGCTHMETSWARPGPFTYPPASPVGSAVLTSGR